MCIFIIHIYAIPFHREFLEVPSFIALNCKNVNEGDKGFAIKRNKGRNFKKLSMKKGGVNMDDKNTHLVSIAITLQSAMNMLVIVSH